MAKTGRTKKRNITKDNKVAVRPEPAKMGAPTKYRPEFCQMLEDFFDEEPWDIIDNKRVYRRMPSLLGFAKKLSICYHTIYNWIDPKHASYHENFLHSYNKALKLRKQWLIDVGLSGLSPSNSFKFVAVNCTDMRDKSEKKHDVTPELQSVLGIINGSTKGKLPSQDDKDSLGTV